MPRETTCDCSLCEMELRLLASLAVAEGEVFSAFTGTSQLQAYASVADLVLLLRTSPAHAHSDGVLGELLKLRAARPTFTDSLLVLVFVPMLHRTVRRVVMWQPLLAKEDVVQQALGVLLEFLRSDDMRVDRRTIRTLRTAAPFSPSLRDTRGANRSRIGPTDSVQA